LSLLSVALLQMAAAGSDLDANRKQGEAFCREARARGADVALFPEMWSNGYRLPEADAGPEALSAWRGSAVGADGDFVAHFRTLARELEMAIALTYLERFDGAPRDSVSLIDRHGEIVLTYAKVHTCDFDRERQLTPGDAFHVCALDTAAGPVQVGLMICYDREFPESARVLMLKGAELILTPNSCTLDPGRIGQFRARAYENMVGVAMANYAAPRNNGHSVAFDACAFRQDETPLDTLLVEADEAEGVHLAVFDLERLRAYRARETWGNAFRKPRAYETLTSLQVHEPFLRPADRR
jgi:predicted amidohydrolase